jgi:hypothetical protein
VVFALEGSSLQAATPRRSARIAAENLVRVIAVASCW